MALAFSTVESREVTPVAMAAHAVSRSISLRDVDLVNSVEMLMGDPEDSVIVTPHGIVVTVALFG
jgi:hypothetical protein